ncbi:MAG: c-type cytochrome [Bacteroidota bacterium]|nr:c-type cytochrome [Ferruginibacter sp.]
MAFYPKTISIVALVTLAIFVTAGTTNPPRSTQKFKNLKVLPQDITEKQLDSTMKAYNKALQVSCDFCHVKKTNITGIPSVSDTLDFPLDNGMKDYARKMIRLSIDINKNYFYSDTTIRPEFVNVVSCNTCHRGNPYPAHE